MNAIVRKAKAGVTLVELLVVILIVTILSVSLLPLLKPFIEEAKYAAEPIPVLANLQTKIELYAYEHEDKLPCATNDSTYAYYTWVETSTQSPSGGTGVPGGGSGSVTTTRFMPILAQSTTSSSGNTEMKNGHLEDLIKVDWQDLKGKRMRPDQFQYCVTYYDGAGSYCYAVGVFGNGIGLSKGTGYAVCKLVDIKNKRKVVGTWKNYKADAGASQLTFSVATDLANKANPTSGTTVTKEPVMPANQSLSGVKSQTALDTVISGMKACGWEFD